MRFTSVYKQSPLINDPDFDKHYRRWDESSKRKLWVVLYRDAQGIIHGVTTSNKWSCNFVHVTPEFCVAYGIISDFKKRFPKTQSDVFISRINSKSCPINVKLYNVSKWCGNSKNYKFTMKETFIYNQHHNITIQAVGVKPNVEGTADMKDESHESS